MLLFIPLIIFLAMIYFSHEKMKNNSSQLFDKEEIFNSSLIESISNIETIKNYQVTNLFPESVNHLGEIFSENLKILCLWRYVFLQCFHPIVKKYLESYNPKTLAVIRFLAHFHLLGSRIQVFEKKVAHNLSDLFQVMQSFFAFNLLQTNMKNLVISLFNLYVLGLGAYLVINNNFAAGSLLVFNSSAMRVFNPFLKITNMQAAYEQGEIARLRYQDILNTDVYR